MNNGSRGGVSSVYISKGILLFTYWTRILGIHRGPQMRPPVHIVCIAILEEEESRAFKQVRRNLEYPCCDIQRAIRRCDRQLGPTQHCTVVVIVALDSSWLNTQTAGNRIKLKTQLKSSLRL